jgi:hypothetical protein
LSSLKSIFLLFKLNSLISIQFCQCNGFSFLGDSRILGNFALWFCILSLIVRLRLIIVNAIVVNDILSSESGFLLECKDVIIKVRDILLKRIDLILSISLLHDRESNSFNKMLTTLMIIFLPFSKTPHSMQRMSFTSEKLPMMQLSLKRQEIMQKQRPILTNSHQLTSH